MSSVHGRAGVRKRERAACRKRTAHTRLPAPLSSRPADKRRLFVCSPLLSLRRFVPPFTRVTFDDEDVADLAVLGDLFAAEHAPNASHRVELGRRRVAVLGALPVERDDRDERLRRAFAPRARKERRNAFLHQPHRRGPPNLEAQRRAREKNAIPARNHRQRLRGRMRRGREDVPTQRRPPIFPPSSFSFEQRQQQLDAVSKR